MKSKMENYIDEAKKKLSQGDGMGFLEAQIKAYDSKTVDDVHLYNQYFKAPETYADIPNPFETFKCLTEELTVKDDYNTDWMGKQWFKNREDNTSYYMDRSWFRVNNRFLVDLFFLKNIQSPQKVIQVLIDNDLMTKDYRNIYLRAFAMMAMNKEEFTLKSEDKVPGLYSDEFYVLLCSVTPPDKVSELFSQSKEIRKPDLKVLEELCHLHLEGAGCDLLSRCLNEKNSSVLLNSIGLNSKEYKKLDTLWRTTVSVHPHHDASIFNAFVCEKFDDVSNRIVLHKADKEKLSKCLNDIAFYFYAEKQKRLLTEAELYACWDLIDKGAKPNPQGFLNTVRKEPKFESFVALNLAFMDHQGEDVKPYIEQFTTASTKLALRDTLLAMAKYKVFPAYMFLGTALYKENALRTIIDTNTSWRRESTWLPTFLGGVPKDAPKPQTDARTALEDVHSKLGAAMSKSLN